MTLFLSKDTPIDRTALTPADQAGTMWMVVDDGNDEAGVFTSAEAACHYIHEWHNCVYQNDPTDDSIAGDLNILLEEPRRWLVRCGRRLYWIMKTNGVRGLSYHEKNVAVEMNLRKLSAAVQRAYEQVDKATLIVDKEGFRFVSASGTILYVAAADVKGL